MNKEFIKHILTQLCTFYNKHVSTEKIKIKVWLYKCHSTFR